MEDENNDSEIITDFGFRDISVPLRNGTLDKIRKYDVIRNIWIKREEQELHNGKREKIYHFTSLGDRLGGRIFPMDEIIHPRKEYDIIVQNWKKRKDIIDLDAQIYHDFYRGEELKVKVSRKTPGKDPSFKVFNHISGFIKDPKNGLYEQIDEGSGVLVEVFDITEGRNGYHVKVWPLEILDDGR